jgi:GrpB-like predicted nucleotidyltransferase (UPF0157 family)
VPLLTQERAALAALDMQVITHAEDRDAYGNLKRSLALQEFSDVMHYNNAKASLIYDIYERIFLADPANEHDPRPRN